MWALGFVPLVIMYYIYHSQKVKKLENKIKRIDWEKTNNRWTIIWNRQLGSCGC